MSQKEEGDKPHEPTARKLEKAREKGEIPRSQDLSVAASYGGLALAMTALGASSIKGLGTTLMVLIDQADSLGQLLTDTPAPSFAGIGARILTSTAPFFVLPAAAVIAAVLAQRAFVITPSKLAPKLSRISIIKNAGNKFGRNGLFEFGKSFVKLLIYSATLGFLISDRLPEMAGILRTEPRLAMAFLMRLSVEFLFIVVAITCAIGAVDFLWQRSEHLRKNRMTDKEIRDENKEAEGDPYMKRERRTRAQEIAMTQMMSDVPAADVVITNPTHFAVALRWSRLPGEAPICVAKGADEIAARIRELAQTNAVPLHRDPPTARAIYATTRIGDEIDASQYRAVAAAIRFADQMRHKAKAGWR